MSKKAAPITYGSTGAPPPPNDHTLAVTLAGVGVGRVLGPGIDTDAADFSQVYPDGTIVTLQATPQLGSDFSNWSGEASGVNQTIQVTMNEDRDVTANFVLEPASSYKAVQVAIRINPSTYLTDAQQDALIAQLVACNTGMVRIYTDPSSNGSNIDGSNSHQRHKRFAAGCNDNGIIPMAYWEYAMPAVADATWDTYMTKWVNALHTEIQFFEAGNEPDRGSSVGMGRALDLGIAASPIIRAATGPDGGACKSIMVAAQSGSTATFLDIANDASTPRGDVLPAANPFLHFDGVAIHAYMGTGNAGLIDRHVGNARGRTFYAPNPNPQGPVNNSRIPLALPLWITELGLGTNPPYTGPATNLVAVDSAPPGQTAEEKQRDWLNATYNTLWPLRTSRNIRMSDWFKWKDQGSTDGWGEVCGLRYANDTAKLALTAFKNQPKSMAI